MCFENSMLYLLPPQEIGISASVAEMEHKPFALITTDSLLHFGCIAWIHIRFFKKMTQLHCAFLP